MAEPEVLGAEEAPDLGVAPAPDPDPDPDPEALSDDDLVVDPRPEGDFGVDVELRSPEVRPGRVGASSSAGSSSAVESSSSETAGRGTAPEPSVSCPAPGSSSRWEIVSGGVKFRAQVSAPGPMSTAPSTGAARIPRVRCASCTSIVVVTCWSTSTSTASATRVSDWVDPAVIGSAVTIRTSQRSFRSCTRRRIGSPTKRSEISSSVAPTGIAESIGLTWTIASRNVVRPSSSWQRPTSASASTSGLGSVLCSVACSTSVCMPERAKEPASSGTTSGAWGRGALPVTSSTHGVTRPFAINAARIRLTCSSANDIASVRFERSTAVPNEPSTAMPSSSSCCARCTR